MNTEQERAEFEAWKNTDSNWCYVEIDADAFEIFKAGYQAGRAALQSRDREEWLKEHEALMHRVSKAAIIVGYSSEGEAKLMQAEKALMDHARRIEGDSNADS